MPIVVDIDVMLAKLKMAVGHLAESVGITLANLSVLKNGRAKAVRSSTLEAICEVLIASTAISCAANQSRLKLRNRARARAVVRDDRDSQAVKAIRHGGGAR